MATPRPSTSVELDLDHMDDGGMYTWAVLLAVVSLAVSFAIAIGWQRWKDERKKRATEGP